MCHGVHNPNACHQFEGLSELKYIIRGADRSFINSGINNLTDDAVDPANETGNVDVNGGTSDLSAGAGGERDDSQEHIVLQNWATRVSSAHTDSSGQGASAHVLIFDGNTEGCQGAAAYI